MPPPDRRSYAPAMTAARSALVVVLALVAVLTGWMLVSLQYGLAETYDSGGSGLVFLLAAIPLGAALVGGSVAGSEGRTVRAGLVIFAVVLVVALVAAAPLGARAHDRQLVEQDRTFSCNGPNAEAHVDERVDAAFMSSRIPHSSTGRSRARATAARPGSTTLPGRGSTAGVRFSLARAGASPRTPSGSGSRAEVWWPCCPRTEAPRSCGSRPTSRRTATRDERRPVRAKSSGAEPVSLWPASAMLGAWSTCPGCRDLRWTR